MWTVQDFAKELEDIQCIVEIRKSASMEESLVAQMVQRMQRHSGWSPSSLCQLMKAVQGSKLSDNSKTSLLACLDSKTGSTLEHASSMRLTKNPQSLLNIENYLSKKDWVTLENGCSWDSTVCMASRLKACGLQSMKEDTKKACAALLAYMQYKVNNVFPSYPAIYSMSQTLHDCFEQLPMGHVASRASYPEHPAMLGNEFLDAAYKDDEPEARKIPGLASLIANHTPVRSTSSLLGKTISTTKTNKCYDPVLAQKLDLLKQKVAAPDPGSCLQNDNANQACLQMMKPKVCNAKLPVQAGIPSCFVHLPAEQATASSEEAGDKQAEAGKPDLQIVQTAQAPAMAQPAEKEDSQPVKAAQVKSLQDYEAEAYEALQQRAGCNSKLKNAKQKSTEMKKPSCSTKTFKKPAASVTMVKQSVSKAKPQAKTLLLGCIRCRGNINGCQSCISPTFKGLRLHGRKAWLEWRKKHMLKKM